MKATMKNVISQFVGHEVQVILVMILTFIQGHTAIINNYWMHEAEYLMKNNIMESTEGIADNTPRDLFNSSYDTKAEFNNCLIIHSI